MNRRFYFFFACLCALSTSSNALEITYTHTNPFSGEVRANTPGSLLLKGEIVPGDYAHLLEIIRKDPERFWNGRGIVLASAGGDVQEAMKIANFVRRTYQPVFVGPATGACVSACFFIFAAAASRDSMAPAVGIHRPYVDARRLASMSLREAEITQRIALQQARLYLEDLDVPTELIDAMFQRASIDVYWLSNDDLTNKLGRHPPWYEQFLIARCGFSKSLERENSSGRTNDRDINRFVKIEDCGIRLAIPEARAFLAAELKKPAAR